MRLTIACQKAIGAELWARVQHTSPRQGGYTMQSRSRNRTC